MAADISDLNCCYRILPRLSMNLLRLHFYILFLLTGQSIFGQTAYISPEFPYDSLMNISYGSAIDYAGHEVDLLMDIYKPLGEYNCKRPIMVLVHGGAWIAGSRKDPGIVTMARAFAQRGWVAAAINYRLGTHKTSNYSMFALCNDQISAPCGYISDSAEVYRANYRAMQDAKGAIRFLKSRHNIDSTDIDNVYIAGESAGGFVALAVVFTDQEHEKHPSCYTIDAAPVPDPDLLTYGCIPSPNDLSRPDLGHIEGHLHTGTYDATVQGAGSLYGGVLDLGMLHQANDTPWVYLFHQGSDIIVHYQEGRLLGRMSWECFAQIQLCQSYHFYPTAFGGESIRTYFNETGSIVPRYQADIVQNYMYLGNCFSNGHSLDNPYNRMQSMVELFAEKVRKSGNNPWQNCLINSEIPHSDSPQLVLYPNPVMAELNIKVPNNLLGTLFQILHISGQVMYIGSLDSEYVRIKTGMFPPGLYALRTASGYSYPFVVNR